VASTENIEAFLAEPRNVVIAGIRRDGRPHLIPNWFDWDGQRFYVSTTRGRVKCAIFPLLWSRPHRDRATSARVLGQVLIRRMQMYVL
jgi:hypothetical protein